MSSTGRGKKRSLDQPQHVGEVGRPSSVSRVGDSDEGDTSDGGLRILHGAAGPEPSGLSVRGSVVRLSVALCLCPGARECPCGAQRCILFQEVLSSSK